jgi:TolB-like protein/Tfp pilus assembly protein PilF
VQLSVKPSLFAELQRRNVIRAAVLYIGVVWALSQGAAQLLPVFGVPTWAVRWIIVAAIVGFPFWVAFAWFYEFTPQGLKRESEIDPSDSIRRDTGRRLDFAIIGVLALAVVLLLTDRFVLRHDAGGEAATSNSEKSIAVLPFENFSADPENAYFADGVQDDLLTILAKIGELKVISRTSVMQYRGGARNVREIGKALGVGALLEGSVRRAGNRVRVNVQLIDAVNDKHLWAEDYDRDLTDVFALQTDLAQKIARELQARLSPSEQARITRKPTENGEAYLAFVQAHNLQSEYSDLEKLKQSEQLYQRALQLDPDFALAAAGLSQLESWIYHTLDPSPQRVAQAHSLAERALKLQPDCPECRLALGFSYYYGERDYDRALKEFSLAQPSLPNEALAYLAIGAIQRRQGKWAESTANLEKAAGLSPNDPWFLQNLSFNYMSLRDFDRASDTLDRALNLKPDSLDLRALQARVEIAWKGTFEIADRTIKQFSAQPLPDAATALLAVATVQVRLWQGNYAEALQQAEGLRDEVAAAVPEGLCAKYESIGVAKRMLKDESGAQAALLSAKRHAETYVAAAPDEASRHAKFAGILAWLGEKDAAIAAAKRATEMLPENVDALEGPEMTKALAEVYAIVGEQDKAIDLLDGLLSRPSSVTVANLRFTPIGNPLRDNPRFVELLKKYGAPALHSPVAKP